MVEAAVSTATWVEADCGGPLQVTWPWMPVPEYSDDVGGGRLRVEGELPRGGGDRDVEAGDARGVGDVGAVRVAGEPEPGVGCHRPAMSIVGQPSAAAAFHRAASSAESPDG